MGISKINLKGQSGYNIKMVRRYFRKKTYSRSRSRFPRYSTPRRSSNDIIRPIYVRYYDNIDLDVSGNISLPIKVQDVENNSNYPTYVHGLFGEVQVLSMKVRFIANAALVYGQIGMTALYMTPYHTDVPGTMNSATASETLQTRTYSVADPSIKTLKWVMNPQDSAETTFYSTTGTSLAHVIPSGLGGIYIYSDGPVGSAGTSVGTILTTWKLRVRNPYILN